MGKPRSLFRFLRWIGGLCPHPDLNAILDGRYQLIRKHGMSLDRACAVCVEEGFLQDHEEREHEPTISDLLELIDAEARGQKQYRIHEWPGALELKRECHAGKAPGLIEVIHKAGSMRELAAMLGISMPAVARWRHVPTKWLLQIEAATGIPRQRLRPELYEGLYEELRCCRLENAKSSKLRIDDIFDDPITAEDTRWVRDLVCTADYRVDPRPLDWLGVEVAKRFNLDLNDARDKLRVCTILRRWVVGGVLRKQQKRDPWSSKSHPYYVAVKMPVSSACSSSAS